MMKIIKLTEDRSVSDAVNDAQVKQPEGKYIDTNNPNSSDPDQNKEENRRKYQNDKRRLQLKDLEDFQNRWKELKDDTVGSKISSLFRGSK